MRQLRFRSGGDSRRRAAEGGDVLGVNGGAATEHGRPGDQNVRSGAGQSAGVRRRHAAVNFDVDITAADHFADLRDAAYRAGHEVLAGKAGVDAHHQHQVDEVEDLGDRCQRCGWVESDAGALAERAHRLQRTVDVRTGFDVDGEAVGAGFGEGGEVRVGRRDHQVDVERLLGDAADGADHHRADGEIRHEVAVHDIDVDPVGA